MLNPFTFRGCLTLAWLLFGCTSSSIPRYETNTCPTVQVLNGTYTGVFNPSYNQDMFLGMPYAQPPIGEYRLAVPKSLNSSWEGTRNATEYSPECIGYGSDDWVLGNYVSEDCLTINVIRPKGVTINGSLPVAVWIYGGGYFEGGSLDPRYNISFILQQSVSMQTPFIAVSFNYRLAEWGFLFSQELLDAGATNLGLRDQRLALHWIQENIKAFGGDPAKVTIWGESAGAFSVAAQLIAYGGRNDGLFRGGIQESGGAAFGQRLPNVTSAQPVYDAIVNATNCTQAEDTLACLRTVPSDRLSSIFNSSVTTGVNLSPAIDGDFIQSSGTTQLRKGQFVKVPVLIGTNFDEGTAFGVKGINTTEEFVEMVMADGPENVTAQTISALYPNIPEIGIPATLQGPPPPGYGAQFKRSAAYGGDFVMHAQRRLQSQMWAKYNQTAFTYHFNVVVNGVPAAVGATHFQEVAFVFHNVGGQGYMNAVAVDPFTNEPKSYPELSNIMSRMWVSFIVDLDPNHSRATTVKWPKYSLHDPQNIVFNTNITGLAYAEPDIYRAEGIAYISDRLDTVFGR
ncbi:hypothetical protein B7494_g5091 [Chlorociboria aeruginascens]|nr:hypothetical protein B7494_g5091 [Chlorociboria aeruginascens]